MNARATFGPIATTRTSNLRHQVKAPGVHRRWTPHKIQRPGWSQSWFQNMDKSIVMMHICRAELWITSKLPYTALLCLSLVTCISFSLVLYIYLSLPLSSFGRHCPSSPISRYLPVPRFLPSVLSRFPLWPSTSLSLSLSLPLYSLSHSLSLSPFLFFFLSVIYLTPSLFLALPLPLCLMRSCSLSHTLGHSLSRSLILGLLSLSLCLCPAHLHTLQQWPKTAGWRPKTTARVSTTWDITSSRVRLCPHPP
jgi:hypothetical protein